MKSKLFIGRLNEGITEGSDGVVLKNRFFFNYLQAKIPLDFIDLDILKKKNPGYILSSGFKLLKQTLRGEGVIMGSGGSAPSCKLIRLVRCATLGRPIWILGLGGNMHEYIVSSNSNLSTMSRTKAILAEGKKMVEVLHTAGLKQAYYIPNFKNIEYIPEKLERNDDVVRFVFFARVHRDKGCNEIFEATRILNEKGLKDKFEVHFYGYEDIDYQKEFEKNLSQSEDNVSYEGARDTTIHETYQELASYDAMLFPTYWGDEGFPATVVDAFIAGLPVIATDWKCNGELIKDGKNGFLIPIKSATALAERMEWFIEHKHRIPEMAEQMQKEAMNYDIKKLLSDDFLKEIGLLHQ